MPRHLRDLDQFSSELVNGEEGGSWSPTSPIVIGHALGDSVTSEITLSTAGSLLSGDIDTVKGNDGYGSGYLPGVVLEGGALPVFESVRSRIVTVPLGFFAEAGTAPSAGYPAGHELDPLTLGARTNADYPLLSITMLTVPLPLRAQHRGATIASVEFRYVIPNQRSALPATKPRFRVVSAIGETYANLNGGGVGAYDANGWYVDQAANAAAYHDNGRTRSAIYVPNVANTNLDPSSRSYSLQILDETPSAIAVGNLFLSATVTLTNIANMQQE